MPIICLYFAKSSEVESTGSRWMVVLGTKVSSTGDDAVLASMVQGAMAVLTAQGTLVVSTVPRAVVVWTVEGAKAFPMFSGPEVASAVAETGMTSTEQSAGGAAKG